MPPKTKKTVALVVADRCVVYLDDVAHRAGARITVTEDAASSLLEQGVAYNPNHPPTTDEDEPDEDEPDS